MKKNDIPFWLVWNPSGFAPKFKHATHESAETEATRLARENPGKEFYVIMPVTKAVRHDVVLERYVDAGFDDLPF